MNFFDMLGPRDIFAATTNGGTTQDVTLDGMLKTIRDFDEKFPPESRAVRIVCGEESYRYIREVAAMMPRESPPVEIESGLPIELDTDKNPQWCEVVFADGSSKVSTPVGWMTIPKYERAKP